MRLDKSSLKLEEIVEIMNSTESIDSVSDVFASTISTLLDNRESQSENSSESEADPLSCSASD